MCVSADGSCAGGKGKGDIGVGRYCVCVTVKLISVYTTVQYIVISECMCECSLVLGGGSSGRLSHMLASVESEMGDGWLSREMGG